MNHSPNRTAWFPFYSTRHYLEFSRNGPASLIACILLSFPSYSGSLEGVYIVEVGQNADLPCSYSPATPENLVPVCWGKGHCPVFECYRMLISTNGRSLKKQLSSRYQLKGNFHEGDVSLTIKNVTFADSGIYCCRIQFPGLMNDKKSHLELVIKPGEWTFACLIYE